MTKKNVLPDFTQLFLKLFYSNLPKPSSNYQLYSTLIYFILPFFKFCSLSMYFSTLFSIMLYSILPQIPNQSTPPFSSWNTVLLHYSISRFTLSCSTEFFLNYQIILIHSSFKFCSSLLYYITLYSIMLYSILPQLLNKSTSSSLLLSSVLLYHTTLLCTLSYSTRLFLNYQINPLNSSLP